jgi:hypothetical protein
MFGDTDVGTQVNRAPVASVAEWLQSKQPPPIGPDYPSLTTFIACGLGIAAGLFCAAYWWWR